MSKNRFSSPGLATIAAILLVSGCRPAPGGLERLSDTDLDERFRELHSRLYAVYEVASDRNALHDLLASSFAGEALTQQYVEQFVTLQRMKAEATHIDILEVDYENVRIVDRSSDTVALEADWSVGGIVTHQSHKHPRVNRYRASYRLAPEGDGEGLRIVDTRMLDLERVRTLQTGDLTPDAVPRSALGLLSAEDLLRAGLFDEEPDEADVPATVDTLTGSRD